MSVKTLTHTGQEFDTAIDKIKKGYKDVSASTIVSSDMRVGKVAINSSGKKVIGEIEDYTDETEFNPSLTNTTISKHQYLSEDITINTVSLDEDVTVSEPSTVTASADHYLNKVIVNPVETDYVGTIYKNIGARAYIPKSTDDTIISGPAVFSGNQTIATTNTLLPKNIKKDVSIFGIDGSATQKKIVLQNGKSWTQGTMPVSAKWQSVTYGNGMFVAVSDINTTMAYSTDGINWTQGTMPSSTSWQSVTYGNGMFVAVAGSNNTMAYSTDGINWTKGTMPSNASWQSVTYGNGMFVAIVGGQYYSTGTAYSTDGINWTQGKMPNAYWYSVTYGNGMFVAITGGANSSSVMAYSTDGINWTQGALPSASRWQSVTYGNGMFVAVAYGTNIMAYSTDGINWTQGTMPIGSYWRSVAYGNGMFVAVSDSNTTIAYSTDGINWTRGKIPSAYWYSVTYGNGMFVAIAYSTSIMAYSYCNPIEMEV